jgi:prepilin-type N-terminal cleavage/methylation domain-containing protein
MQKLLFHMLTNRDRKNDRGFTLIELLVVIIIIGILAAIALPSFLNQANKARQSEAQTYIGAMNRAQQAYYLENREFSEIGGLELGLSNSENYLYSAEPTAGEAPSVLNVADPTGPDLRGYAGSVWLGTGGDGNATTLSRLCTGEPGVVPPCPNVLPTP